MYRQTEKGGDHPAHLAIAIVTVSLSLVIIYLSYMGQYHLLRPSLGLWSIMIVTTLLVALPLSAFAAEFDEEIGYLRSLLPTDRVTGLISAGLFDLSAQRHLERRKTSIEDNAIVLFEIDNFLRIQHEMGEEGAERLLRKLSEIVYRSTRGPQDKLARIEGAKFILMLTRITLEEAEAVCARLMETLQFELRRIKTDLTAVTLSFGIAPLRDDSDLSEARENAEHALHDAVRFGGSQIRHRAVPDSDRVH